MISKHEHSEQPPGSAGRGNRIRVGRCRGHLYYNNGGKIEVYTRYGCKSCDQFVCLVCFDDYHKPENIKNINRNQKGDFNSTLLCLPSK
jgi:hypothetical protein